MKRDTPHILLVNPWIHDFAAYDVWAKPLGLLTLASILRFHGFNITYLDCLDRFHPKASQTDPYARNGRGPYLKTKIPKPGGLEDIPRNFSRYGIKEKWFREDLRCIETPDLVLMTSMMTYWYTGVQETINVIKETFSDVTIVLGGIYASLCYEHALNHSGAHRIVTGPGEKHLLEMVGECTGFSVNAKFDPDDLDTYPYPAFEIQKKINYIPLQTSKGCPFACKYCASHYLNPKRMVRSPESVVEEIRYHLKKYKVKDFVFYDDALLVDAEKHAIPMLEGIINAGLKIRFHTPNAVHIREISRQTARLMFQAGFKTLRLGLETTSLEIRNDLDKKVTVTEFTQAVTCLKEAGFDKNMIGVYLLAGLPGQQTELIENSIQSVKQTGATPILAYYSPIPKTSLWDQAVASSRYPLESDPIFTNNAILPCQNEPFSWKTISRLKKLAAK
ncbi:MAG: B12-binding domain-containing radical SAM protein [Deltaproteobacteria bacterium]|nr:B12-binding domain-containing radical SAM protein [Deltaproteobacteria bacterium]MBW2012919.1 B12-binding domain-containing radical SAM protein [Deltaproteobacteria bacterium]MBW2087672.1 B12-binding domain-containing radical SAM protein [Deltaproteobacteria bacterium]MBW2320510.1 B12-binding domain-containing radical SAM protein [Deltaproteobacteria bacterium]